MMECRLLLALALAAVLVFAASASKDCDAAEGCCGFEMDPGTEIDTAPATNGEARPQNQPLSLESNEDNRRVLITGSNQGLGLATSLALARLGGYDLTMTCRSQEKCTDTLKKVKDVAKKGIKLECEIVDFASMASVKALADKFVERARQTDKDHFDVAILNAGILVPSELKTADNLETSFQVNYLYQYLLLKTVIGIHSRVRPDPGALSVITMTSFMRHVAWTTKVGHVTSDPGEWGVYPTVKKTCSQVLAYARSKWATAALTVELNNKFPRKQLHAVAFNPGFTDTNMSGTSPDDNCIRKFIRDCMSNTPEVAAQNVVYIVQHIAEFGTNQYRDEGTTRTLSGSVVDPASLDKLRKLTDQLLPHATDE